MATLTKTYTENSEASYRSTWTFTFTSNNVNVTGSTVFIPFPTITAKYAISGRKNSAFCQIWGSLIVNGNKSNFFNLEYNGLDRQWAPNTIKTLPIIQGSNNFQVNTTSIFNASNKTTKEVGVYLVPDYYPLRFYGTSNYTESNQTYDFNEFEDETLSSFGPLYSVVLNVPPTFSETLTYTGDFGGVPYANLTTANVTLSSLTAYYGGDFTGVGKAEFTIGSQTVSKANPVNSDVLSIPLNAVGTFTPTVKITDSRGQVTTHTLNAITVQGYVAPSVSFNVERTLPKTGEPTPIGKPDDEGESATITATFNFTDAIATLSAPTVAVTDDDGITQTVSTTWYSTRASDGTLSGSVTWANLTSGDTVYGLVSITGDFNTQKSYQIAVTPEDSQGTGTTITQTLGSAFYTVDFLAGGHGIAFGKPAVNVGFECGMDATFDETLIAQDMTAQELSDFINSLSTSVVAVESEAITQNDLRSVLDAVLTKSAITATCASGSTDQSLTTTAQIVSLATYFAKSGDNLAVVNGGVRCEKDGYVVVSVQGYFASGFTANDLVHLTLKENTSDLVDAVYRVNGNYSSYSIAPIVQQVSAGTMFYLYSYNQTASRGYIHRGSRTYLTVAYL